MKYLGRSLLALFVISMIVSKPLIAYASDGSLQINTNIGDGQKNKEVYYIEQEEDLSQLFNPELTEQIAAKQELTTLENKAIKDSIFVEKYSKPNWSKEYQELLFTQTVTSNYSVQMTEKEVTFPLFTIALFVLGLIVMIYSIYQSRRRKGN